MGIERLNNPMRLAFSEGDWGEAPRASGEGTEVSVAMCAPESSAPPSQNPDVAATAVVATAVVECISPATSTGYRP